MSFRVQAVFPDAGACESAADMADAVGEMYASANEQLVLVWNDVAVRLTYDYDLAVMLDDLVPLLEDVLDPEFSGTEVRWGPDTFAAEWMVLREDDFLRIRARWHSTHGNCEAKLAEQGDVVVDTEHFVWEWSKVLRRVVWDIETRKVKLEDEDLYLRAKALTRAGLPSPSEPVHPLVVKRARLSSEWFYECRARFGVDDPWEGTPEQEAEYEAGMAAIYARISEEYAVELREGTG